MHFHYFQMYVKINQYKYYIYYLASRRFLVKGYIL